jgi:predicted ATPase
VGDDAYSLVLDEHHRIVRQKLDAFAGHEEGTQGDAFFAVFTSTSACVAASIEMQQEFSRHTWPHGEALRVRMGIHTGEASEAASGLVGYEVHRAARIASVGYGGQVLLSAAAAGLVEDSLAAGVSLRSLGAHRLKDLGRPEVIFQLEAPDLASDFPALRSLDNPELPNNLPVSLSPFIGRLGELGEVRSLISQSRLVTLTGPGGSGKTRLALQAAAELLDGSGDGVWLVELAPVTDEVQVPNAVLDALRLRSGVSQSSEDELIRALREQAALIIFDNCEHVVGAVAKLVDLIGRHCPKVWLVATSREPLGIDGEQIYRVPSLSSPPSGVERATDLEGFDSVDLFMTRARLVDSGFSLDDSIAPLVASVCQRLDGIPLAIELAVARLSSMSLVDLHDRLDHRFRLLTGGSRNALPRHQTLGATVAWSYDLLSEPERGVLRRLSVFINGFDLRAAEVICSYDGVESFDVADVMASLVNKSLVNVERTSGTFRYRMLETIRQYAADRLLEIDGESGVHDVRRRHAEFYLEVCESEPLFLFVGRRQASWMRTLDSERENLLLAFAWFAVAPDGAEQLFRLAVATEAFLNSRWVEEPIGYLYDALNDSALEGTVLRGRTISVLTLLLETLRRANRGDFIEASHLQELAREVVEVGRSKEDKRLEIFGLLHLADFARRTHDGQGALEYAKAAEVVAQGFGDADYHGHALLSVARLSTDEAQQRSIALSAVQKFREAGDLRGQLSALISASILDVTDRADLIESIRLSEEALEIAEEASSMIGPFILSMNLGFFQLEVGDVDAAEIRARRTLQEVKRLGHLAIIEGCSFLLACCATLRGDFVRGAQLTGCFEQREAETQSKGSDLMFWGVLDLQLRSENHRLLLDALGLEEYERHVARGRGLSVESACNLALGKSSTD